MRSIFPILTFAAIIFTACRGGENKADVSHPVDTVVAPPVVAPKKDTTTRSGQTRSIETIDPDAILSKIDQHLVSSAQFTAVPGGGISNCLVTVTNTLPDAGFQKVIVEVAIRKDDGTNVRVDYYTIINIEPKMSKVIKVPNTTQGSKVISNVIKVKSAELTKGEWVLAGNQYVAN